MLTEIDGQELLYTPSEGSDPRPAFACRITERCAQPSLRYPTYVLSVSGKPDPILGTEFAVTVPYQLSGLRTPDTWLPVHTYKSLTFVLGESLPSQHVLEFGVLTPLPLRPNNSFKPSPLRGSA